MATVPRLCLYYRVQPEGDRWLPGDRFLRPLVRRVVRGRARIGGVEKVFVNLCLGLDRLGIQYAVNLPFDQLRDDDRVAVLGRGHYSLESYDRVNAIVAGIGLMTHPTEWPGLCEEFPVIRYLQHSEWANDVYKPYFGSRCEVWPVGIDTGTWKPSKGTKDLDVLLYDKIRWEREHFESQLIQPIRDHLARRKLKVADIRYGSYREEDYLGLLARSRSMIFLTEHESQGIACQECMASDVPVLAWDQGWCLDPNRFKWGAPRIKATSVPYFDRRCGERFRDISDFESQLDLFLERLNAGDYQPRSFVLERLTLEDCANRFVRICDDAFSGAEK